MATMIKAIYEDGVFKPEEPVSIPEHTRVEVSVPEVEASAPADDDDDPTGWKAMNEFIGMAGEAGGTAETNAAEEHDEILYGRRR